MNKQGNSYTFIYSSVMVIVVAAVLALVSQGLKPLQERNELVAKKTEILRSVNIESSNKDAEAMFDKIIGTASYVVNFQGEKIEGVTAIDVDLSKELRKNPEDRSYPIYEARLDNGELKYILQFRGAGLWGPIWGYVSVNNDGNTIYGATFGHKGETPGLGAEIEKTDFQKNFQGKQVFDNEGKLVSILVVKGGASAGSTHEVDAVSGGTITSKGLEAMLKNFFQGYENYLKNIKSESHE